VDTLTGALPSKSVDTANILAPVVGDRNEGTGVAGVLGLLQKADTSSLSASLGADLDQSISAKLSIDTSEMTGSSLEQVQRAVDAVPQDPATLTQPIGSKLDVVKKLVGPELSAKLLRGFDGLADLEALLPADTRSLIDAVASRLSLVKGEM
jgi:hypothetical protein